MTNSMTSSRTLRTRLELERERRKRAIMRLPLRAAIPAISPDLEPPDHLEPILGLFDRIAQGETVRALISVPPQHGKTMTILHGLAVLQSRRPQLRHAYVTYAQEFTRQQSSKALRMAQRVRLEFDHQTLDRWRLTEGGGVVWTSVGGPLTGLPVDGLLIVDDPLKSRADAESATIRQRTADWFGSVALSRLHPGSSVIVVQTRWHRDDLIGRLSQDPDWEVVNLPAIQADGTALWPSQRPLWWLEQQRQTMSPYDWAALYLGAPTVRGEAVFNGVHYYDQLPTHDGSGGPARFRESVGADWAYTASTKADWNVALWGRLYVLAGEPYLFLTDMIRAQAEAPRFGGLLASKNPPEVATYASGTESGAIQYLIALHKLNIIRLSKPGDKFVRATTGLSVGWNAGRVLVPRGASWADEVVRELLDWTGTDGEQDDIVDAMTALYDRLVPLPSHDHEALKRAIGY